MSRIRSVYSKPGVVEPVILPSSAEINLLFEIGFDEMAGEKFHPLPRSGFNFGEILSVFFFTFFAFFYGYLLF